MSGYRADQIADLIESAVDRYMSRGRGSVTSSSALLDLETGWARISHRARAILSRYARNEEPPPAIDIVQERAEVERLKLIDEPFHSHTRRIRETMALHQLGAQMSRRPTQEARFYEAHHAMGRCEVCGKDISPGDRFRGQRHEECFTQALVG